MPRADKPLYCNLMDGRKYIVGITGTGAADPTKRYGDNVSVIRTAVGVYRFSFLTHPGALKSVSGLFRATAPGAVKGYTATVGDYVAASGNTPGYVEISIWNSLFAATDLAAAQFFEPEFTFAEMGG